MQITRNYVHRTHGKIGHVTLDAPDGTWKLDGVELPRSSVEHLVTFALQTLQDAYAGAGDDKEAVEAFNTKRQRLIDGTLGVRLNGTSAVDTVTAEIRARVMKAWLHAKGDKATQKARKESVDDMTKEQVAAHADAIFDKCDDDTQAALRKMAEESVAAKEAERKRKAQVADKVAAALGDI